MTGSWITLPKWIYILWYDLVASRDSRQVVLVLSIKAFEDYLPFHSEPLKMQFF